MKSKFILLIIFLIILTYLNTKLLKIDELVLNSLVENLAQNQIEETITFKEKWQWLSYALIPILLLIKISIISAILDLGCFFFNKKIKYKKLFNIVVKAEFIFLLVIIVKTVWFYFFKTDYSLEDLQYFYPLSAINIVGYEDLDPWWIYPLQVFNLFELAYWFILAYLLGKAIQVTTDKGVQIVASSYGVGLLIWVVGIMFFTLNMS